MHLKSVEGKFASTAKEIVSPDEIQNYLDSEKLVSEGASEINGITASHVIIQDSDVRIHPRTPLKEGRFNEFPVTPNVR